jgi:hypothetical protein
MKNKKIIIVFFLLSFFILPLSAHAGVVPCGNSEHPGPCTLCHLIVGFWNIIDYGFKIMVFIALTGLVIAGIMYIVSAGSEELIKTAKTFIKQILGGLAIILCAWLLIFVVMNYFGVKGDLGIQKADGWAKFTCDTNSSAVTSMVSNINPTNNPTSPTNNPTAPYVPTNPTNPTNPANTSNLNASPSSIAFSNTSETRTITFTNGSVLPLTGTLLTVSGSGFTRPAGSAGGTCANGQTLNPSATCTVSVTYSPSTANTTGNVTLTAGGQSMSVNLTGTGTGGNNTTSNLTASPNSVSYPSTVINSLTFQTVNFTNTGNQNLTINSVNFSNHTQFNWDGSNQMCTAGKVLAPNEVCDIHSYFHPTSAGTFTGIITIGYNSGSSVVVNLSGNGMEGSAVSSDVDLLVTSFRASGAGDQSLNTSIAIVKNAGSNPVGSFIVKQYLNTTVVDSQTVSGLAAGASTSVSLSFIPRSFGVLHTYYKLYVVVDPDNAVKETNESNNESVKRDFEIL